MRLWHKKIIKVLPDKMLLSQWRELSAIVGSINKNGTPNHRLVNILMDYPKDHLYTYTKRVYEEMKRRNFKVSNSVLDKIYTYTGFNIDEVSQSELYSNWHNKRYLIQCLKNLEEKYDRGIIEKEEWENLIKEVNDEYLFN